MPAMTTVLDFENLTGVVNKLPFPDQQLLSMIPKKDTASETVRWDITQPRTAIDTNFGDQRMAARPAQPLVYTTKAVDILTDFWFKTVNAGEIINYRKIGTDERDAGGRTFLDAEALELARRFGGYKTEYMIAQMLQGTLNFQVDSVAKTLSYEVPASHIVNASASWSTVGTNIINDVDDWQNILGAQGEEAEFAILNRTTFTSLMRNTDMINLIGSTNAAVQVAKEGRMFDVLGLKWLIVNGRYGSASAETYDTKLIPDDTVILLPRMTSDWITLYEGLSVMPTANQSDFDEVPGAVSWSRSQDSPVGVNVYYRYSRLPVMTVPEKILIADVS